MSYESGMVVGDSGCGCDGGAVMAEPAPAGDVIYDDAGAAGAVESTPVEAPAVPEAPASEEG